MLGNGAGTQASSQILRKFTKFVPDRPNRWRFPCDKPAELVTFAILAPRRLGKISDGSVISCLCDEEGEAGIAKRRL
jgi:hypothetical protein